VRLAAHDGAIVLWPEGNEARAFAVLLAEGWIPGMRMHVLRRPGAPPAPEIDCLRKFFPVEELTLAGRTAAAACKALGASLLLAADPPGDPQTQGVQTLTPLEGWPDDALDRLPALDSLQGPRFDEHELVGVAMQRMRRLGYL
jgi:hypothetical protein